MQNVRWILTAALVLIASTCAAAYPFHEIKRDTLHGIDHVTHIDPILDWNSHQLGFVLCDSSTDRLLVNLFDRDTLIQISMPCAPVMTVTRVSGDSIVIYALLRWSEPGMDGLTVGSIVIADSAIYTSYRIVPTYSGSSAFINALFLLNRNIKFARQTWSNEWKLGLIVEVTMESHYSIPGDGGSGSEFVSTAILYDLRLDSTKVRRPYATLVPGTFLIADSIDYIGAMNVSVYKPPNDSLIYAPAAVLRGIRLDSSVFLTQTTTGSTFGLAVDRISSDWTDDLIVHARHSGFLKNHPTSEHLAAYSIRPDTLIELWYRPLPSIYPMRWQLDGFWGAAFTHLLWRGDTCLYRFFSTGYILDSVFIPSDFQCKRLYDFGADLYLALRTADTLRLLRWDVATSIEDTAASRLPSVFSLSQNYPNPFNASTEINFSLEKTGDVRLTVYNLLGQEVKSLANGRMTAGEHRVTWDGSDNGGTLCATGLYLYRLEASESIANRKMLLLK